MSEWWWNRWYFVIYVKALVFSVSFFLQAGNHCWLCGKNCNSEKQWQQHITSEKHKERVFNSEDDQNCWQYRFPTGTFKVCERWVDERFGWWSLWGCVPGECFCCQVNHNAAAAANREKWKDRKAAFLIGLCENTHKHFCAGMWPCIHVHSNNCICIFVLHHRILNGLFKVPHILVLPDSQH